MKVFRDLYLHLPYEKTDIFFNELTEILNENWSREIASEEKLAKETGDKFYYFSCVKTDVLEPALVAFARKNQQIVYIANIVPREFGSLTKDQYNTIIIKFYEKFLSQICDKLSIQAEITSDNQSMQDWVSEETYKKIKSFSGAANKSTGSSHPCDQERWFAFIVSVFRKNEKLDPSQLERWLVEDEGWHYDIASDLAIEYEQGLALLGYFASH